MQPPRGTCPLLHEEPRRQSPVLCGGSSLRFLRLDQLSEVSVTELGRTWNKEHSIAAQCDLERESLFTVKFVRLRLIRHLLDSSDSQLRPMKAGQKAYRFRNGGSIRDVNPSVGCVCLVSTPVTNWCVKGELTKV